MNQEIIKKCDCCNTVVDELYPVVHSPLSTYPNFIIKSEVCMACKTRTEYLERIENANN